MNTEQEVDSFWSRVKKSPQIFGEVTTLFLGTLLASLWGFDYSIKMVTAWQSCSVTLGADCFPYKVVTAAFFLLLGIAILSYRQAEMMCFVGTIFFGLFIAGFCGITTSFVSPYPWWQHASVVIIGIVGAGILWPRALTEELEELLG